MCRKGQGISREYTTWPENGIIVGLGQSKVDMPSEMMYVL